MKRLLPILTMLLLNTAIAKQKYYKWTNKNGSIHYSTKKPENSQTDELDISTRQPDIPAKTPEPEESDEPEEKSYLEQRREKKQRALPGWQTRRYQIPATSPHEPN